TDPAGALYIGEIAQPQILADHRAFADYDVMPGLKIGADLAPLVEHRMRADRGAWADLQRRGTRAQGWMTDDAEIADLAVIPDLDNSQDLDVMSEGNVVPNARCRVDAARGQCICYERDN